MNQAADKTTHSPSGKNPSALGAFGMDFLDTAWRIAVPVIVFTVLGIVADRTFGTAPFITFPAVVVGFVFSGLLVKRQLKVLEEREEKSSHES
jgi:F0F1-type ATP synthase assembly protein I